MLGKGKRGGKGVRARARRWYFESFALGVDSDVQRKDASNRSSSDKKGGGGERGKCRVYLSMDRREKGPGLRYNTVDHSSFKGKKRKANTSANTRREIRRLPRRSRRGDVDLLLERKRKRKEGARRIRLNPRGRRIGLQNSSSPKEKKKKKKTPANDWDHSL